ncbi:hypothetical protein GCK32_012924 [Trichostrongylus colubriformis]|uniref:Uncharacterized protein n=1 Tax=Trichostrongylus colubriformis TaxID=6319 RepID=A0AAN8EVB8_TRICO
MMHLLRSSLTFNSQSQSTKVRWQNHCRNSRAISFRPLESSWKMATTKTFSRPSGTTPITKCMTCVRNRILEDKPAS